MSEVPIIEIQVNIGDGWLVVARMDATDVDCWCGIDTITENAEAPIRVVEEYGEWEEYDSVSDAVDDALDRK